jgi:hypothetical protein
MANIDPGKLALSFITTRLTKHCARQLERLTRGESQLAEAVRRIPEKLADADPHRLEELAETATACAEAVRLYQLAREIQSDVSECQSTALEMATREESK